ncbi:hypothetical protein CFY87_08840 [Actinobacillus seminis]|uniref:Uncharacterized protein n=1 Tax=Actinobacillus seminis TaxID=722 RepID=A0A263HDD5_9PAST|nr:hypothetical protein [Actinobacillus seminis]OZN24546.1 hypothetical protein CFY87_08840 [Actinobacillus seminis]SUU38634.1 Uncharacterised protein [Actinobacillus seminis]
MSENGLISQLKKDIKKWWVLDDLTIEMIKVDRGISEVSSHLLTPKTCLAVYNVLKKLRA